MYCPRCNKEVDSNSGVFCNICGSRLVSDIPKVQDIKNNNVINKQELEKCFIGYNYDKLKSRKFSIPYFFFGGYYALYRKMYLLGIAVFALNILLLFLIPNISSIIMFILNIVICFAFNKLYFKHVDQLIDNIIDKNKDNFESSLSKVCTAEGGTNMIVVIIAVLLMGILSYVKMAPQLENIGLEAVAVEDYKNLSISHLAEFKKNVNESTLKVSYVYETNKDLCNYSIETISSTTTAYKYLTTKEDYTAKDTKNPVSKVNINKNEWDLLTVNTSSGSLIYDYAIIYNHDLYDVSFRIYRDTGVCTDLKDKLIKSMTLKKTK